MRKMRFCPKIPFVSTKRYEEEVSRLQQEKARISSQIPKLVAEQTEEERKKLNDLISRLSRVSLERLDHSRNLFLRTEIDEQLFRTMTDLNDFGCLADHVAHQIRADMYKLLISGDL